MNFERNLDEYAKFFTPTNENGYMETPHLYTNFDEFIQDDFEIVFLFNHAHQHAPFAVKALRAGKNVLSECVAFATLKEAIELIEAVEETGKHYALIDQTSCRSAYPIRIGCPSDSPACSQLQ